MIAYTMPAPPPAPLPARTYIHHKQAHVAYLAENYNKFTLLELQEKLGIPWRKILRLAHRHGIKKRRRNKRDIAAALAVKL